MALTGRAALITAIGALVAVAFRGAGPVLAADLLIAAAIAADVMLAARIRQLRITRSGDQRLLLGEQGTVLVTVTNTGRRWLRGLLRDAWEPSAGAAAQRRQITVPPGGTAVVYTRLVPVRRGDRRAGRVTVRSYGPLGLAARQGWQQAPWTVRVLPPFLSRKHLPEKLAMLRLLDGQHRSLLRGQGSEFDSLREYVLGDDVRSIDWRSTARRSEVLVRTWRPERDRRIILVLDTGRTSAGRVWAGGGAGLPRLDTSMDAALLLTALANRAGDRVDLLAIDRAVRARVVGVGRNEVLSVITNAMATLESELTESDPDLIASTILGTARQRCLVVLLTDLNPAAIEEGLLPRLQVLAQRYQLMVAAVSDPRLAEMAADRTESAAVYDAAAAEYALAGRARVSAELTRRGVIVVDAPPDRLPPALADAYLELKGAGRL
jgi:uncharacterized protein (DUF58 family)